MPKCRKRIRWHILWFVLPAMLIYSIFMIIPLFSSLGLSMFSAESSGQVFIGLKNYTRLWSEEAWRGQFLRALGNSFKFFAINMVVQNPVALLLATLLAAKTRGSSLYRTFLYAPATLSLVAVAFVWQMLLNPMWGIAKDALSLVGLGELYKPWLGQEKSALTAIALISAWQNIGVPIILYYAALISIPVEIIEASKIDGASSVRTFFKVQLPFVVPMFATVSLMTYIFNFNAFDLIFALKGPLAGPNFSTDTMMSFFFRTFYGYEFQHPNPTMGTAIAGMIFLIMLAGVIVYMLCLCSWNRRTER